MGTRALIIGKTNDGSYRFGQTHYDGYQNTEWLQRNMTNPEKVEDFFRYLTEGGKNGKGHEISCFTYENYDYDKMTNPYIKWFDTDNHCCGIAKTKEEMAQFLRGNSDDYCFLFCQYLSYWNGKEWVGWDSDDIPAEDRGYWDNIFLRLAGM